MFANIFQNEKDNEEKTSIYMQILKGSPSFQHFCKLVMLQRIKVCWLLIVQRVSALCLHNIFLAPFQTINK